MEMEFISLVADEIKVICWWTLSWGGLEYPKKIVQGNIAEKKNVCR